MKCTCCGGDTEITVGYDNPYNRSERNIGYQCIKTRKYGVACEYCRESWHTAIKPYTGRTIHCPNPNCEGQGYQFDY